MRSLQSSAHKRVWTGNGVEGWPGKSWVWELGGRRDLGQNGILPLLP